jgi:hypothetical protein
LASLQKRLATDSFSFTVATPADVVAVATAVK